MRIKGLIKRITVLASAVLMGASLAMPVCAEGTDDGGTQNKEIIAIMRPGTSYDSTGSHGFSGIIADVAGGKAEDVEYVVWCDEDLGYRPAKEGATDPKYTSYAKTINTTLSFTADDGKEIKPTDNYAHVWAWYDKDGIYTGTGSTGKAKTVYVYTNATKVYMHPNMSGMFYDFNPKNIRHFTNLKGVSLFGDKLDWSYVTSMRSAFYKCENLERIDLSGFTGKLTSNTSMARMFARMSSLKELILPDSWNFVANTRGATGLMGDWTINGTSYTSYKIETAGTFHGGTYTKVTDRSDGYKAADYSEDNHDTATYQAEAITVFDPKNIWEIHDTGSKFTAFCIDGHPYNWTTEDTNTKVYPGSTVISGYYTKEKWNNQYAESGLVDENGNRVNDGETAVGMNYKYYFNTQYYFGSSAADQLDNVTDEYKAKAPGKTIEEVLTALLYWGPQVYGTKGSDGTYSITTEEQYKLLQQDIWCFTNWYGHIDWLSGDADDAVYSNDHAKFAEAWKDKTYDSIPSSIESQLYVYKSKNGAQNVIAVSTVKAPEYDVEISKTDITGKHEIEGATLIIKDSSGKTVVGPWTTKADESGNITPKKVTLAPGTYTLTEETAPEGYVKAESITFSVDKNGKVAANDESTVSQKDGTYTVTMKDNYNKVNVAFYKINGNGDGLGGAKIKLTLNSTIANVEKNTDYIAYLKEHGTELKTESEFEPDATDGAVLELYPGKYTLSEETAPTGYGKAENITFTVDDNGNVFIFPNKADHTTTVLRFNDKTKPGNVTPTEYDSLEKAKKDTKYPLKTEKVVYNRSDAESKTALDHIFMVDNVVVKISKVDIAGEEIPGAKLIITDKDGKKVEEWTTKVVKEKDEAGKEVEKVYPTEVQLAPGEYTLTEETAPNGYLKAESITFTVGNDGKVSYTGKNGDVANDTVRMTDKYQPTTVIFAKVEQDSKTGEYSSLKGASLILKTADKDWKETGDVTAWTSTSTDKTIDLTPGNYIYREQSAPDYYRVADDIKVRVKVGGDVYTVTGSGSDEKETKVSDKIIKMVDKKTTVIVSKLKASDKTTFLSGAQLQINDASGKKVVSWKSGTKAETIEGKLKVGVTYTLHEVSAPSGYEVAKDITFTCKGDDQKIVMYDAEKTEKAGTVTIKKVDSTSTSKYVSGAKLQILDSSSNIVEEWTSGSSAYTLTKELTVGKIYRLHEVSAPSGYTVASDITFTATTSAKTITMKDTPESTTTKTYTITVSKVDENGSYVSGAKMQVLDSSGKVVDTWTTPSSGGHAVTGTMTDGKTYTVHEVSAPDGYELAADQTFTYSKSQAIKVVDKKKTDTTDTTDTTNTTANETTTDKQDTAETNTVTSTTDNAVSKTTAKDKATGDASNMAVWIGLIVVATATAAGVIVYRKKKN